MWRVFFAMRLMMQVPFFARLIRAPKPGECVVVTVPEIIEYERLEQLSEGLKALGRPFIILPESVRAEIHEFTIDMFSEPIHGDVETFDEQF